MTDDTPTSLREGRYQILRELGHGGQAATFEAAERGTDRRVAIKQFRVRGASSWKEVELAEREAKVLAGLSHPLLPRYVEHFEEGGALYLVTELVDGDSLASLAARGVRFEESDALALLSDLGETLRYLHRSSPPIIHRDVKPGNVVRRRDGRYVLVDFGAVRHQLRPDGGSTVVGTFGYMAPEQFQGRAMPASDVYGAAATALWMLTATQPEALPHRGLAIDVERALPRGVDRRWVTLLSRALAPDPDVRATELAPLVEPLRAKARARPAPEPRRAPARHETKREKKERKRREKAAEREARRAQRRFARGGHTHRGLQGPLLAFVLLGLSIAQFAVVVALCALVPAVLRALAPLTHPSLKEAARASAEAGRRAYTAIASAKMFVRGSQPDVPIDDPSPSRAQTRVRFEDDGADPVEAERRAVEEAAAEEEAQRAAERAAAKRRR